MLYESIPFGGVPSSDKSSDEPHKYLMSSYETRDMS